MAGQVIFLRKNWADIDRAAVSSTASEANDLIPLVFNRSNTNGWATTDSVDANATTIEVQLGDTQLVHDIILAKHNFKSYVLYYYNVDTFTWVALVTTTTNTDATTHYHSAAGFYTSAVRVVINGTFVANEDKYLYQWIVAERLGQLAGWPVLKPTISRELRRVKMLSGKFSIIPAVGAYGCRLSVTEWKSDADLTLVETLYESNEGFLIWPCGGDEDQFSSVRKGFRMEDLFLVRCSDELTTEFARGQYGRGLKVDIDLVEVIS